MSLADEMTERAKAIRQKLMRPPNSRPDYGINLRPYREPLQEPPKSLTVVTITELGAPTPRQIELYAVLRGVSHRYGVGIVELKGRSRRATIAFARHVSMYLALKHGNNSTAGLGRFFGRDHATVIYGRDKIKNLVQQNTEFKQQINELESNLFRGIYD